MTHGGFLTIGGLALAALLLAGCAATTPGGSASPSVPPSSSTPNSTPSPSATPAVATKPGSRVPLGCAALLDPAAVSAIAGAKVTVDRDENSRPTDLASVAQLQFGALTCVWDGLARGSEATKKGAELTVSVAPDSKDAFDSRFSAIMATKGGSGHPAATLDIAGDQSGLWCANDLEALGTDSNLVICDGELLVSGYWVGIQVDTVNGFTRAQLTAAITAAMKQIATKLAAAGPAVGQWVAPETTPPALCTSPTATAKVQAIIGGSHLKRHSLPRFPLYASTIGSQAQREECYWTPSGGGGVVVELLAGGSWSLSTIKPVPIGDSTVNGPYVRTAIPGAGDALIACGGSQCDSYFTVGTTAVEIATYDGLAKTKTTIAGLSKVIADS